MCETVSQPRVRVVPHQPHFPVKKSLNLVKSYSWAPNMFWVVEVWTSELNIIMLVIVCEFSASPASLFSLDWVKIRPERPRIPQDHLQFKHLPSRKLNDSFKGDHVTFTACNCAFTPTPEHRCVSISVRRHRSVETSVWLHRYRRWMCRSGPVPLSLWEFTVFELRAARTCFLFLF